MSSKYKNIKSKINTGASAKPNAEESKKRESGSAVRPQSGLKTPTQIDSLVKNRFTR